MIGNIRNNCREFLISVISVHFSETILPFLGTLTLLNFLPAFLYGCSVPESLPDTPTVQETGISLTKSQGEVEELDIFVFKDDPLQRLDCYLRIEDPTSWNEEIVSRYGDRIIVICANSGRNADDWAFLSSFASLKDIRMSLEEESAGSPFMSGAIYVPSGNDGRQTAIHIRPLYSTVELRSISCDFAGKPYAGERMTDVKVYLTNVNAECGILDTEGILPSRIINAGGLRDEDMETLPHPSMLAAEIKGEIGRNIIHPGIDLICYPNNSLNEGPGTPFTRLVIEGKVSGVTYYWPIDINREGGGICRNERYVYDIRITRKGSTDPDTPVNVEDTDILFRVEKWKEEEDCPVRF